MAMTIHNRFAATFVLLGIVSCGCEGPGNPTAKQSASSANPFGGRSTSATEGASREKVYQEFMPGTRITLKPRKERYFLGENILLDYQISYDGDGAVRVWTATGFGADDCRVTATDQAGVQAPRSTLPFHCTGQSGGYCRRGQTVTYTIPLVYYCRLERPGSYRIRAAHDLYWSNRDPATRRFPSIPREDPRWAETTIEVSMPDDTQARSVVEHMCRVQPDVDAYRHMNAGWEIADYADCACLQYPVYLPILEKLAKGEHGDTRALMGITHIPTPQATETLFRLLKDGDKARIQRIIAALCDRLPDLQGTARNDRINPIQFEDADPKLVKRSWRGDFAVPIRQLARKMLTDKDPISLRFAAFILETVDAREDMPALTAAVSRVVLVAETTKPSRYVGEIALVRQACTDLTCAIEALAARGVEPTADPRTPGEIVQFILAIKQRKDFRPAGWAKRCGDWIQHGTPYVRECVLFNAPRPLQESLLETYRAGVRQVIAATQEQTVIHVAVQFATEAHIPVDEILEMIVDRMVSDEPQMYVNLSMCMSDLLETGKHEHLYADCTGIPDKEKMATLKAAWRRFLRSQGQAIRYGKHFTPHSPELAFLLYS
jgi:hypothetical protein